ncbi:MAG TPA: flagellar regulator YcgR PilZN domain-containing protein [Burkholderiales bacterium]
MADKRDADGLAARTDQTGQLLVRSGIEIRRTLEAMRAAGDALSADLESEEHLFVTLLLEVDRRNRTMTVGWSESKEANALILQRPSITFNANHEGLHFQFVADHPRQTDFGNRSALQLGLPKAMFAMQRRALPRYIVPPTVPLKCEISLGPVSFDALVVDLSFGGIGAILYDASIRLDVGMTIPRARILLPAHAPVLAALEVRNIGTVTRADGSMVKRAGCRFIAPGSGIESLVRLFLAAVEAAPG